MYNTNHFAKPQVEEIDGLNVICEKTFIDVTLLLLFSKIFKLNFVIHIITYPA